MIRMYTNLFTLLLLLTSCIPRSLPAKTEAVSASHPPVVERYYSPDVVRSGDVLRFFVTAADEDADMSNIAIEFWQMGVGEQFAPYIRIPEGQREHLNGFLYMRTPPPTSNLFGERIRISAWIIDKAGNRSKTVSQEIYFGNESATPVCPPEWENACENPLGPIRVDLRPFQERGVSIQKR
ncbi:MAG: hypothetical protein V1736_02980 [Pseudomonadota bacterium]